MAFGDVLAGLAEAGHQHRQTLLQMDYEKRKSLADLYGKLSQDQSYPEEARTEFLNRALQIHTLPPEKKLPKEWENMTYQVQPPKPAPITTGLQGGSAGATAGMMSAGQTELPPAEVQPQTLQPPTPPAQTRNVLSPLSFEERLGREKQQLQTQFDIERQKLLLQYGVPKKVGQYAEQDPDGHRYMTEVFRHIDPDTQQEVFTERRSDAAMSFFAPRNTGEIAIDTAIALSNNGASKFLDRNGKPLDLEAIKRSNPNIVLRGIGEGRFEPIDQRFRTVTAGNEVMQAPTIGAPTPYNTIPMGAARTPIQSDTAAQRGGVDAQGNIQPDYRSTVRTPLAGAPFTAPPAAMPQPSGTIPGQQPQAQPPLPPNKQQPVVPTKPMKPQLPNTGKGHLSEAELNRQRSIAMPVREVMSSLYGDPQFPGAPTVESYSHIASDPDARQRVGGAINLILHAASSAGGGPGILGEIPLVGDMLGWLRNHGITQKLAESEAGAIQKALGELNDDERQAVHQVIAAYGTIPGLRVATRGSAYQFYVKNLELELPTFGNIASGGEFHEKMGILGRDAVNAVKNNMSETVVPKEELDRYILKTQMHFALARLSDAELATVDISSTGARFRYNKGGNGPVQTINVKDAPIPPVKVKSQG